MTKEVEMTGDYPIGSDVLQPGRKTAGEKVGEAVHEKAQELRKASSDYLARGKEKAVELEEGLEESIQGHPIRSILIAAGIGVVLGALISRR